MSHLRQGNYDIRCEWGIHEIHALRDTSDCIIIIDVLSFTTTVDVALSRSAIVFPFAGKNNVAATFAQQKNAILAHKRAMSPHEFSLSPSSLQRLPVNSRVVLPSPNGSTLSTATEKTLTLAGCLRNARAVAEYAQSQGKRISIIPAGERFIYSDTDTALRPSLEDWIGAGAIITYLNGTLSLEAQTAKLVFEHHKSDLHQILHHCVSGVELSQNGYTEDIQLASQLNISEHVPVLVDGAYQSNA